MPVVKDNAADKAKIQVVAKSSQQISISNKDRKRKANRAVYIGADHPCGKVPNRTNRQYKTNKRRKILRRYSIKTCLRFFFSSSVSLPNLFVSLSIKIIFALQLALLL